jgi:predicted RNA methylase
MQYYISTAQKGVDVQIPPIWSNTDFPYQCLRDSRRTTALRTAIFSVVKPGDVVVDAGAGSGILSFFAAAAGAGKVYAVEIDPLLAESLTYSVQANNLEDIVEVINADIRDVSLLEHVDVFIGELIETGLMDEMQVPVINILHQKGIITPKTRMIPFRYEAFLELGYTDFTYYGYKIFAPKHDWPHYTVGDAGWTPSDFHTHCTPQLVRAVDFTRPIESMVEATIPCPINREGLVNAVRISGRVHLARNLILGATNALNGDKILPLEPRQVEVGQEMELHVSYEMGGGLISLRVGYLDLRH